jgi:beta-N-acetylhexosaminidase
MKRFLAPALALIVLASADPAVARDLERMTPEEKVGQLFVANVFYRPVSDSTDARPAEHLAAALRRNGARADLLETGSAPDATAIAAAVSRAAAADAVVVATSNASGSAAQRALVDALIAAGKPVVVVATRNPYDVAQLPRASTYLASYSWTRPSMRAVARVLLGRIEPTGRLPVRIPAAGDPATTLYRYGHGL